jgi:hypothetical protein
MTNYEVLYDPNEERSGWQEGLQYAEGLAGQVAQGLTLGWSDELAAKLRSITSDETYEEALADEQGNIERFREQNPGLSLSAEIAGGFAPPARLLSLGGKAINTGRAITSGVVGGGLYGAGASEEGDRLTGATVGAGVGGLTAGMLHPLIGGLTRRIARGRSNDPQMRATRQIQRMAEKDLSPQELAQLRREGKAPTEAFRGDVKDETALVDAGGDHIRAYGEGVANTGIESQVIAAKMVEPRKGGEYLRVMGEMARQMGGRLDADSWLDDVLKTASNHSAPIYQRAYRMGSLPMATFRKAFAESGSEFRKAYNKVSNIIRQEVAAGKRGVDESDLLPSWDDFLAQETVSTKVLHQIKRGLDIRIYGKKRPERGISKDEIDALEGLKDSFNTMIGRLNPDYARANKVFSLGQRVREAVEDGSRLRLRNDGINKIRKEFADLRTEIERKAYRSGALQELATLFRKNEDVSIAGFLGRNNELRDRLRILFPDASSDAKLGEIIMREFKYNVTRNDAIGNSRTLFRAAAKEEIESAPGALSKGLSGVRAGAEFVFSPFFGTAREADRISRRLAKMKNKGVAEEAAKLLYTNNERSGQKALDTLQRNFDILSDNDNKILRAFLSTIAASGTPMAGYATPEITENLMP